MAIGRRFGRRLSLQGSWLQISQHCLLESGTPTPLLMVLFPTAFPPSPLSFDYSSLGTITCVGLAGLVALRQMNGAVWGPLFSVSLDFQDELVLDTSLRFHTNQWRTGGQGEGPGGRGGGSGALLWHVLDILATQWLPDVFTILAWYGLYTWLPLRWPGTSRREEL